MHIPLSRGPASGVGEHRQDREAGRLVYPVISRRSGGLSLGINLFPRAKLCNFDCPYCEVFPLPPALSAGGDPSSGRRDFAMEDLEAELEDFLGGAYPEHWADLSIRDLCISGNGEPSASPLLGPALELLARLRASHPGLLGQTKIVLITNSTGFLDEGVFSLLERCCRDEDLVVWAKLDAGSEGLFRLMSGLAPSAEPSLEDIAGGLLAFAKRCHLVVQTMLCEVEGRSPTQGELEAYAALVSRLAAEGALIDELHLYTLARPSPGDRCAPLGDSRLLHAAEFVRGATGLGVRAFGLRSELASEGKPL
jgi:wyosine [tRNA(Phe)-imidazoG37] synthetase (radical SAM superfamily)